MPDSRYALVVDDHSTYRLLVAAHLKKPGWTVMEAANGAPALTQATRNRLLRLDISMSDLS